MKHAYFLLGVHSPCRQQSGAIMKITTQVRAITLGVLAASQFAHADTRAMEEIIVTAQKRDQSVLDVAATMDVISAEFLERTNTTELDELSRVLPNVVIQEQAVSLPSFNIRGITDDTASDSATPRISVYQDGFDISKKNRIECRAVRH
jgi:outer membrane receptor protein involved in Fe transport